MTSDGLRVLFVNENLGGHAAMAGHLRATLPAHPEVIAEFFDVPRPGLLRRVAALPVPGLARLDADLQPLRYQLAQSLVARRHLASAAGRCDVVHAYTQNTVLLSSGLLANLPAVVSTDGTNLANAYQLPYRRPGLCTAASLRPSMAVERRVWHAATLVVAQSEWAAGQFGTYGIPPERVRIIPFGIQIPPLERAAAPPGPPIVTFVGTTMARKGGWTLLRAFDEALRDRCRLVLVTRDPVPPRPGLTVIADAVPGDARVSRLLAQTAVFALPTDMDKSPYAVLEAMAAGVPVVATRVGAIPEMVPEGVAGVLVEPEDWRGLASVIGALLDDEERRRAMGLAARRHVVDRFDARRTTAQLVDVLVEAHRLRAALAEPRP